MALTLRHIEVLRAVLRAGTVTRAARQLAVSQPALSRTLRNAETRLGLELFERAGGRLSPTPEALALQRDIERAYAQIATVERASADLRRGTSGQLAVVSNPSAAIAVVAVALGRLRQSAPELRVSLHTALNHEVVEAVRERVADVGFAWDVPSTPTVVATEIARSPLVCLLPADHALAGARAVSARQLHDVPLISFSTALPIGAATDRAFAEAGVARRIGIEVGQTFIAAALVRHRAGIAIVDSMSLSDLPDGLAVRPFVPRCAVHLHALTRPERASLVVQRFLALATDAAAERGGRATPRSARAAARARPR